jgi:ABC-type polysaccharide/polyol phosphate export permease
MTGLVESFRGVLVNGQAPSISVLLPSLIGAVAMLTLGLWYFRSTEKRFPDAI